MARAEAIACLRVCPETSVLATTAPDSSTKTARQWKPQGVSDETESVMVITVSVKDGMGKPGNG